MVFVITKPNPVAVQPSLSLSLSRIRTLALLLFLSLSPMLKTTRMDASRRQHLNATQEDSLLGFSLSAEDRAIIAESVKTHREEENEAEGEGLLASPSEPLKSPESDSDEEEEWVKKAKGKVLSRLLPDLLPEAPQRPREPRLESAGYAFYVDEKVEREIGLFLGRTAGGPKGTALEGQ
eukprot:1348961-Amorphochlora_amoeboformis.AAC.1